MQNRTEIEVQDRWNFELVPKISNDKKRRWVEEEDEMILKLHAKVGNKWSQYEGFFEGRTYNAIRNRFNTILKPRM